MKKQYQLIDLTHTLNALIPTWEGTCGFKKMTTSYGQYQEQSLEMVAGIGTHMDAPFHFNGELSVADIPLKQLVVELIVIDVSGEAHANYAISVNDIITFEENYGTIPPESLVIGYTGWSKHWDDPIRYRNVDEKGQMYFPSFDQKAAEILLERGVAGIAIDTLSPDVGLDGHFPVHELFLGAGKYIIENVANAHLLPPKGAYGIVLPLKVAEGAEAPVRFIALIKTCV